MSWLLPSALALAGIATLVTVALHCIARSRPVAEALPTARFVPTRSIRARTRSLALTDVPLLLLRLGALVALGAGLAGPVFAHGRGRTARVIVADESRAVANVGEVRDSVRALLRPGDALVAFDTTARVIPAPDSLHAVGNASTHGSLSAGLAAGIRAAVPLGRTSDSLELVIVSPLAQEEFDDATTHIRESWPGRMRLVRVSGPATATITTPTVETTATSDDAVIAGLSLMGVLRQTGDVRLVRGTVRGSDSAWARQAGRVLVHWPSTDAAAPWPALSTIDAIGGVVSASGVLVGRFPRLWVLDGPAVARWSDGEPAAAEHALGDGCIREVGILLDPATDLTLRAPFREFVRALIAPCGGLRNDAPADSTTIAALAGLQANLAPSNALRDTTNESSRWTPWLLAAAAVLLLLELALRRSSRAVAP